MELYSIIKVVHIIAGAMALLFGLLAIVLRNKTPKHKPVGRVYFWSMGVIFVTAIYMATVKFNIFLFCVAFFSYYACLTAYRSLRLKKLHLDQKPAMLDWGIELFFGTVHLGFAIFGIVQLLKGNTDFGAVSLVFALVGLNGNYSTIKRLRAKNLRHKNYWLLAHLGGMLGSYIAAITAFTVNNARWIPLPQIVLWLGPTALIVPFIVYEARRQQKLAGKFKT